MVLVGNPAFLKSGTELQVWHLSFSVIIALVEKPCVAVVTLRLSTRVSGAFSCYLGLVTDA